MIPKRFSLITIVPPPPKPDFYRFKLISRLIIHSCGLDLTRFPFKNSPPFFEFPSAPSLLARKGAGKNRSRKDSL